MAPSEELVALETVNESSTQGLSLEERAARLAALADQVSRCTKCPTLARERTRTVFGIGPLDAELCVIGEAPGAQEDLKGEPFVGEAGQLLDKILQACGFQRSQVYICNVLRCRPPANRVPDLIEAQLVLCAAGNFSGAEFHWLLLITQLTCCGIQKRNVTLGRT